MASETTSTKTFDFRPIRNTSDGRLTRAGYRWFETHYDPMTICLCIAVMSGMAGAFLLALSRNLSQPSNDVPIVVSCLAVIALVSFLVGYRLMRVRRELCMTDDGQILVPLGLPRNRRARRINAHTNEIASIEARNRTALGHGVVMILREGTTTWLTRNVTEAESLLIAVQLTKALNELRAQEASLLRTDEPKRPFELVAPPRMR